MLRAAAVAALFFCTQASGLPARRRRAYLRWLRCASR